MLYYKYAKEPPKQYWYNYQGPYSKGRKGTRILGFDKKYAQEAPNSIGKY